MPKKTHPLRGRPLGHCALVGTILKDYEVISAYSMADAVKQAAAEKFELYMLDYRLPDGTGLESCLML